MTVNVTFAEKGPEKVHLTKPLPRPREMSQKHIFFPDRIGRFQKMAGTK